MLFGRAPFTSVFQDDDLSESFVFAAAKPDGGIVLGGNGRLVIWPLGTTSAKALRSLCKLGEIRYEDERVKLCQQNMGTVEVSVS